MAQEGKKPAYFGPGIALGAIAIIIGIVTIASPVRDEPALAGLPALLGIPVWAIGAICVALGAIFLVMSIRHGIVRRR